MKPIADGALYPVLALLMAMIAYAGFAPSYFTPLAEGTLSKTTAVHFHAMIYVGWLALFAIQSSLPMMGKIKLHRRIGPYAVTYGIGVLIAGLFVTISRLQDWVSAGEVEKLGINVMLPLTDMIYFAILFSLAVYFRKKPDLHKRLMVLTGTMLVFPGAVRIEYLTSPMNLPLFYLVWLSPILLAITHDACYRRKFYTVYALGIVLLLTMPLRVPLFQTDAGQTLAGNIVRLLAP